MTAPVSADDLAALLRAALPIDALRIDDDSHLHAGHAGAAAGRHFSVAIVSNAFTGRSRVARHRLVYDAVASLMQAGVHALAIQARTPDETPPAPPADATHR